MLCWITVCVNINTNSAWQPAANELVFVGDNGGDDAAAEHPPLRLPHHPQQEDLRSRPDQDQEHGLHAQQAEGEYYPLICYNDSVTEIYTLIQYSVSVSIVTHMLQLELLRHCRIFWY